MSAYTYGGPPAADVKVHSYNQIETTMGTRLPKLQYLDWPAKIPIPILKN